MKIRHVCSNSDCCIYVGMYKYQWVRAPGETKLCNVASKVLGS
jgi:hypothetical protein